MTKGGDKTFTIRIGSADLAILEIYRIYGS